MDSYMVKFYREQAAKLPRGDPLAERAKEAWKVGNPRWYKSLKSAGVLDDAAAMAAARHREYVGQMIEQGASHDQAVEWADNECFYLEPVRRETREERELGEEFQVAAFEKWLKSLESDQATGS